MSLCNKAHFFVPDDTTLKTEQAVESEYKAGDMYRLQRESFSFLNKMFHVNEGREIF